jgi:hypothetical protein
MKETFRRYVYSLVRCVPDPQTGEFVNIGAIAGDPESGDWSIRQVGSESRARKLAGTGQLDAVHRFLSEAGTQIDAMREQADDGGIAAYPLGENWLQKLHYDLRNVVQLSEPIPIAAEDVEEALDYIFARQIIDPQSQPREPAVTKMRVISDLRNAYRRAALTDLYIESRPELFVGAHVHALIDFAVVASQTLQISQGWSFRRNHVEEVPVQVKAWGYAIEQLRQRNDARVMTTRGVPSRITSNVDVRVVVVPPQTGEQRRAWEEADQVFRELKVAVHNLDEVDAVATEAAKLVAAAG